MLTLDTGVRTCQRSVEASRIHAWLGFLCVKPPLPASLSGLVRGCQREVEKGRHGVRISLQHGHAPRLQDPTPVPRHLLAQRRCTVLATVGGVWIGASADCQALSLHCPPSATATQLPLVTITARWVVKKWNSERLMLSYQDDVGIHCPWQFQQFSFMKFEHNEHKTMKLIVCEGLKGCYSKRNLTAYSLVSLSVRCWCSSSLFQEGKDGLEAVISSIC